MRRINQQLLNDGRHIGAAAVEQDIFGQLRLGISR